MLIRLKVILVIYKCVLCKLFKIYCCSFYGSQMWKINSLYFKIVSISWNKAIHRIVNDPYTTHTWMLGRVANSHAYGVILTHLTCYSRTHAIDKFTHAFKKDHTHCDCTSSWA